jgi:hypothetical protein
MKVSSDFTWEKRLMAKQPVRLAHPQYTTITRALTNWLPAAVWKQLAQTRGRRHANQRWSLHALVTVLLLMSYVAGDSEAEHFVTARAFYVACHQHDRRPGQSLPGFHQALARLPLGLLRLLAAAVRRRIAARFFAHTRLAGFLLFGGDGSRLECPRSRELEQRLGQAGKPDSPPTLWLTTLVLLPLGLLWSWRLGKGTGSEQDHVRRLLATLPPQALLVLDAAFVSYELYRELQRTGSAFVVRMSSRAYLYTQGATRRARRRREQPVRYWPGWAQRAQLPAIAGRLIRIPDPKGAVWLLTNVLDRQRLSAAQVAQIYRWRWQNEGLFRTYKRTLAKFKLTARSVRLLHREAEVSLLALQVLLAQDVRVSGTGGRRVAAAGSSRLALLHWRGTITLRIGAGLGPRQQAAYLRQLRRAHRAAQSRGRTKVRRPWPRRKDHKPPKPPHLRPLPPKLKAMKIESLMAA